MFNNSFTTSFFCKKMLTKNLTEYVIFYFAIYLIINATIENFNTYILQEAKKAKKQNIIKELNNKMTY